MAIPIGMVVPLTLNFKQLAGFSQVVMKYRPHGPMMCLQLCQHATVFSYDIHQFHCHRKLPNEDVYFCVGNPVQSHHNTTTIPGSNICATDYSGEIQNYLQKHPPLKRVCGEYANVLKWACKAGKLCIVKYIVEHRLADVNCRIKRGMTPVMIVAKHGHAALFHFLVNNGCLLTLTDTCNNSLYHWAAWGGNLEVVRNLTESGKYDINMAGSSGVTVVMLAVYWNHIEVFDYLRNKGCDLRKTDHHGNNILHRTADGGHSELLKHIVSLDILAIDSRGQNGFTPLMVAADKGHKAAVEVLIQQGCNLTEVNDKGNNVLHIASMQGHADVVEYVLLQGNPNIDSTGQYGYTSVMIATINDHEDVVETLATWGCDVTVVDGVEDNILHVACDNGYVDIVRYILLNISKIDINSRGKLGYTPIMTATYMGHRVIVELLVYKGCDVTAVDNHKNTVIHIACTEGHVDILKYILSHCKISIETKGRYGQTPMLAAVDAGQKGVFEFLLRSRCDLKAVNEDGSSILHVACRRGHIHLVKYIVTRRLADIDGRDLKERTPLMVAVTLGRIEVVRYLVRKGCNLNARDKQGNTVLHAACLARENSIIKYLLAHGNVDRDAKNKVGLTALQMT